MSVRVLSWVWDHGPTDRSELLVLLALADYADDCGVCFPSMQSVADKARMTERGVQKIIARMVEQGILVVQTGGGRGGCNRYKIVRPVAKNPEPHSENGDAKPRTVNPECGSPPERGDKKPRTGVQKTPNPGSPEPSGTVKEPSKEAREVRATLCDVLDPDVADDFIAHRKAKRAILTKRAAELIVAKLKSCPDPNAAVNESISQGWTGVFPEKLTGARGSPKLAVVGGRKGEWTPMGFIPED